MMKTKIFSLFICLLMAMCVTMKAQKVSVRFPLGAQSLSELNQSTVSGAEEYTSHLTPKFTLGSNLSVSGVMQMSSADTANGYEAVDYGDPFTKFMPSVTASGITSGHCLTFNYAIASGHTFKPTKLSFDAAKCGTDGGTISITYYTPATGMVTFKEGESPLRNKIMSGNSTGYTHFSYDLSDLLISGSSFVVNLYICGVTGGSKEMAFRNVVLEGRVDEPVYDLSHYVSGVTCKVNGETLDLTSLVSSLGNGESATYGTRLSAEPTDFAVTANAGYTASVEYKDKVATINVEEDGELAFNASVRFVVSTCAHGEAKPLNRGLLPLKMSGRVLVSWRIRSYDVPGKTQYKLYRDGNLVKIFLDRSNYLDTEGLINSVYRLDVCDAEGNVLETQTSNCWNGRNKAIPLPKAPVDTKGTGCTYTPNDATVYDMDGDGEQEIVFRWEPSNVKDAASSGTTGAVFMECVKLDGTSLWRINLGTNIWASQHTVSFLCYDFDGDGFGEMIIKTAPGTIDGEGNYVLLEGGDPTANYNGGKGKPDKGPEYLTIFDGTTGAEISTIDYWPAYRDNLGYGDSNQNRSFRFNSTLAYLDVNGVPTPCGVFNRGYYAQAYYQAVYFDGDELKQLWRHSSTNSGQGMYGEGYHTLQSADVDGDGFDEIVAGSAVLDHDGKTLWRTGDKHGDALHIGDFDWSNPGMEIFAVKEDSPYGARLYDAKTGRTLVKQTASGDTGRGLALDCDSKHDGGEFMHSASASLYDCKGTVICPWQQGTVGSSGLNFRIYWDGDLYDEYHDRQHVDKWDSEYQSYSRLETLYNIAPGASSCNGTKNVPNLQADILGDWREEVIYWYTIDEAQGLYGLNLICTDKESPWGIPYLRDDAVYDRAIAWQNSTYNQPPHLGYSPVLYFGIEAQAEEQDEYMMIPFYSSYTCTLPEGVEAWYPYNVSKTWETGKDTVDVRKYETNVLPGGKGFLLRVPNMETFRMLPTNETPNGGTILANQLTGSDYEADYKSAQEEGNNKIYYYEWRHDPVLGYGFFLIPEEGLTMGSHSSLMQISVNTSRRTAQPYYLCGAPFNDLSTSAIANIRNDRQPNDSFDLQGRRINGEFSGMKIQNGKLMIEK